MAALSGANRLAAPEEQSSLPVFWGPVKDRRAVRLAGAQARDAYRRARQAFDRRWLGGGGDVRPPADERQATYDARDSDYGEWLKHWKAGDPATAEARRAEADLATILRFIEPVDPPPQRS